MFLLSPEADMDPGDLRSLILGGIRGWSSTEANRVRRKNEVPVLAGDSGTLPAHRSERISEK